MKDDHKPIKKICPYKCGKEIWGFSEKHVDYLMSQHILAKHSEMINK